MVEDTLQRLTKIVVDQLGVEEGEVTPSASFTDDLGDNSRDRVELVGAAELGCGIEIPDDATGIRTVGQAHADADVPGR
jgi:acyl carrier protein